MMTTNVAFLLLFTAATLTVGPKPVKPARILAIMPVVAKSHHIFFSSLTSALAARGHHVYSIDLQKPRVQPPTLNVTLLDPQSAKDATTLAWTIQNLNNGTIVEKVNAFLKMAIPGCDRALQHRAIQDIINPDFTEEFDLILLDFISHDCFLGLIHRFNYIPMILASPFPHPAGVYRILGSPVYHGIPHFFRDYPISMTYWQRLTSLADYVLDELLYYFYVEPRMEEVVQRVFGKDVPSIKELTKYVNLAFVNLVETSPKPSLHSNVIPVGGMHIPPVQPLEKKLKDFLGGAKDGAVVLSLGSLVRWETISDQKRDAVFKVFSRLPQRLVWKSDLENLTNIPSNIMILPWIPQNDVLAHPNIRLFISHCGGLSSMEAAFHGVPVLAVPFIIDQYANAQQVVLSGAGLRLPAEELTEETFYDKVTEMLNNTQYYNAAQKTRKVMQDQLVKPMDLAIYYVEYVLRHEGALHLRSPLIDLPFRTHTLLVDIAGVTIVMVIVFIIFLAVFFKIVRCLWRCVRGSPNSRFPVNISAKKIN